LKIGSLWAVTGGKKSRLVRLWIRLEVSEKGVYTSYTQLGMGMKEFFYHCLRLGGVDIPEDETIDARRR